MSESPSIKTIPAHLEFGDFRGYAVRVEAPSGATLLVTPSTAISRERASGMEAMLTAQLGAPVVVLTRPWAIAIGDSR